MLLPSHPQFGKYGHKKTPSRRIPNFLGGKMPSEKKDPEGFYKLFCILFVPWRSPVDLKGPDETWDHVFQTKEKSASYAFVYTNWTILEECYAACDDFHAKRLALSHLLPEQVTAVPDHFIEAYSPDFDMDVFMNTADAIEPPENGKNALQALAIEQELTRCNWTKANPKFKIPHTNMQIPGSARSAEFWSAVLKQKADVSLGDVTITSTVKKQKAKRPEPTNVVNLNPISLAIAQPLVSLLFTHFHRILTIIFFHDSQELL